MDMDTAIALGLLGHPKLLGVSLAFGYGALKHDYLCVAKLRILDVETTLVVKVSRDQPNLLGLDAMLLYDMQISPLQMQFTMRTTPVDMARIHLNFRWLDFDDLLERLDITQLDLVPVGALPTPEKAYQALVRDGKASCVIDLGTTYSTSWVSQPMLFNLGVSYPLVTDFRVVQ